MNRNDITPHTASHSPSDIMNILRGAKLFQISGFMKLAGLPSGDGHLIVSLSPGCGDANMGDLAFSLTHRGCTGFRIHGLDTDVHSYAIMTARGGKGGARFCDVIGARDIDEVLKVSGVTDYVERHPSEAWDILVRLSESVYPDILNKK